MLHTIKRGALCNSVTLKQATGIVKQHDVRKAVCIIKQRDIKISNMHYKTA
jgi:hypothetical protein